MDKEHINRCCENCKAPCAGDFKKVVDLQYSGLVIYIHTKRDEKKKAGTTKCDYSYIVQNTGSKHLRKPDFTRELYGFKTKCEQCNTIIQRVRNLLDEINAIKENEVIGICEHCKRPNQNKSCPRCDFIVKKFISIHQSKAQERQERLKVWLCRVRNLLQAIVEGKSVCKHRDFKDIEWDRIVHALKGPLPSRDINVDYFPSLDPDKILSPESISENKQLVDGILAYIKATDDQAISSDDSLRAPPPTEVCICRSLKEKRLEIESSLSSKTLSKGQLVKEETESKQSVPQAKEETQKPSIRKIISQETIATTSKSKSVKTNITDNQGTVSAKETKDKRKEKPKIIVKDTPKEELLKKSSPKKIPDREPPKKVKADTPKDSDKKQEPPKKVKADTPKDSDKKQEPPKKVKADTPKDSDKKQEPPKKSKPVASKTIRDREPPKKLETNASKEISDKKQEPPKKPKVFKGKRNMQQELPKKIETDPSKEKHTTFIEEELKEEIAPEAEESQKTQCTKGKKGKVKRKIDQQEVDKRKSRLSDETQDLILKMLMGNKKDMEERYRQLLERHKPKRMKMEHVAVVRQKKSPKYKIIKEKSAEVVSGSAVVECDTGHCQLPHCMVRGNRIMRYAPHQDEVGCTIKPEIFKTQIEFHESTVFDDLANARNSNYISSTYDSIPDFEAMFKDGIMRYRLSDKEFIEKGWTELPQKKIMRKMNIYRMRPANPQNDWFQRNKNKQFYYDTGEKLADIDENERGRWYYRNGTVALDCHNAKESNMRGHRYIIYSSGEEVHNGKVLPRTVLAMFDFLGNGIIYDDFGNVRLKYNQSEGILKDPKLGPPSKWKWHNLNEPPMLHEVLVDPVLKKKDPQLKKLIQDYRDEDDSRDMSDNINMLAIEFDNYVKEKIQKCQQKFEPFQIRIKAVKINTNFSLRILDQANIFLTYRDIPNKTSLKLNLGLLLVSNEIIDVDTADIGEVSTPYDRHPASTKSVENIYKLMQKAKFGKHR